MLQIVQGHGLIFLELLQWTNNKSTYKDLNENIDWINFSKFFQKALSNPKLETWKLIFRVKFHTSRGWHLTFDQECRDWVATKPSKPTSSTKNPGSTFPLKPREIDTLRENTHSHQRTRITKFILNYYTINENWATWQLTSS